MINKFKIEQISTDQFVLRRQQGAYTEYINYSLDIVVLGSVGQGNDVIFNSIHSATNVLQLFNSKQLSNEFKKDNNSIKGLSIKSIKFKYKVDKEGTEEMLGVNNESSSRV